MHEVSLMQSTIDIAVAHTQAQDASKIHRIELSVGELSGVVPKALSFWEGVESALA